MTALMGSVLADSHVRMILWGSSLVSVSAVKKFRHR